MTVSLRGGAEVGPAAVELLEETVQRHVAPDARIVSVEEGQIAQGFSRGALHRYRVTYACRKGTRRQIGLVTKDASLVERRALLHLREQGHRAIPFVHTADLSSERAPICLQDLGDRYRPSNRGPVPQDILREEAGTLAAIHYHNLERGPESPWLPVAGQALFARRVDRFWDVWQRALRRRDFYEVVAPHVANVERQAARAIGEMEELHRDPSSLTLTHGDLNPNNVLLADGRLYLIDWQHASYASLYLDLPHHFPTLGAAEHYRLALAELGHSIPPHEFRDGYHVCARYTAIRYLWWMAYVWLGGKGSAEDTLFYIRLLPP